MTRLSGIYACKKFEAATKRWFQVAGTVNHAEDLVQGQLSVEHQTSNIAKVAFSIRLAALQAGGGADAWNLS
jgi:hypothetical protein